MESAKIPKMDWEKINEHNSGHNKNEWGLAQNDSFPKKIRVIEAYTVIWNIRKSKSPNSI